MKEATLKTILKELNFESIIFEAKKTRKAVIKSFYEISEDGYISDGVYIDDVDVDRYISDAVFEELFNVIDIKELEYVEEKYGYIIDSYVADVILKYEELTIKELTKEEEYCINHFKVNSPK